MNHHCIGDELRGYYVETVWASDMVWIVPGTYPEDPDNHDYPARKDAYLALWKVAA